jgi:hypothetical protein
MNGTQLTTMERFINDVHHEALRNDYPNFVNKIRTLSG